MKKFMLLFYSVFVITLISCSKEEPSLTTGQEDVEIDFRKYPPSYVNPDLIVFEVWQAAAFCGGGFSNQIQIWTASKSDCECLLQNFVNNCNFVTNYSPCSLTTSLYPPLNQFCEG